MHTLGTDRPRDARRARDVFFAAPADEPRARRPIDATAAAISWLLLLVLAWNYRVGSDLDRRVTGVFDGDLPGWLSGTATVVYILGGLYGLGLILGIGLFGRGRLAIARDMIAAGVLALAGLIGLSYLAGPEFPDLLPEFLDNGTYPSFPSARLAMIVAALRVSQNYLTVPMRNVGRRIIVALSIATLILIYGTVTGVIGGLLLGVAASSTIRYVFGTGTGIPSSQRIEAGLGEAGLDIHGVEFLPVQPAGASLVRAVRAGDEDLLVKVYGRDAADAALASRLWRALWYRNDRRPLLATNGQLAEHESLMLLTCERAGVSTASLVGWSRASTDDMLVITSWIDGHPLSQLEPDDVIDDVLDGAWSELTKLHDAGITHGAIDRDSIVVSDNRLVIADVSKANILTGDDHRCADRAQMLIATACAAGSDRAISAANRHLVDQDLIATLPFLQSPALSHSLQRDAKHSGIDIDEVRSRVADSLGVDAPEMVQLHRVTWGNLAMLVLTFIAANALISSLTDLGLSTIADELASAAWGWVAVAFVLAQLTNLGEYVTLVGVMGRPAPFGPTMLFRYALSFVSLAVPSEAGAIAMNIRYQQRLGVPAAAAVAQGPLLTVISKGFDVMLLLLTAPIVGNSIDVDDLDFGAAGTLIVVVVAVAAVAIAAFALVPRLRALALPHIKEGFLAVKGSLTEPERLFRVTGGTLLQKVLFAMTLSASVAAYGSSITFAEAVFVNSAVSLFVGLVPVPGGIGVAETAITAGLVSVGVPEEAAVAAAITHRMVTAYMPPVVGWFASRWLTARSYL